MTADPRAGDLRFNVLGPLEVVRHGTPVEIGGIKQRAVLGYLLLRPNRATATSELISALWQGPAPTSARKMVQNAVWRLRLLLADVGGAASDAVSLRSRPPGYLLDVNPEALDLHHFHELAAEGRARMRAGAVATASLRWREALALWRGSMLSDLVEAGITWPELEATEAARLDVLEQYFDAELAIGRHAWVLPELQTIVRAEPRRERFVGQLMLSLHRSGRHTQALDVYTDMRTKLAEELGLEPGRRLQELQQAILDNDPALDVTALPVSLRALGEPPHRPAAGRPDAGVSVPTASSGPGAWSPPPASAAPAEPGGTGELVRERREVSVALINASVRAGHGLDDPEQIDTAMASLHEVVEEETARLCGTIAARVGSVWFVVFGARRSWGNEPLRAVLTVMAVRSRLRERSSREQPLRMRAAVETGDALVQYPAGDDAAPSVTSAALDHAQFLLPLVPLDEVWVGKGAREQTDHRIHYERARVSSDTWAVRGLRYAGVQDTGRPLLGREDGVRTLAGLLDGGAAGPRVALVVGEVGMGKSSMLVEFERLVAQRAPVSRPLLAHVLPVTVDDGPLRVVAAELCVSCGIGSDDPPEVVREKLWTMVERVVDDADEARRVFQRLLALIGHVPGHERPVVAADVLVAWLTLLAWLATDRPVVLIIDDLDVADETVLSLVDRLIEPTCRSRLLVVAATCPELFLRRPAWAVPCARMVTVELPRLSDAAVAAQTRMIVAASGSADRSPSADVAPDLIRELTETVTALADGNPLFAAEFVRLALRETAPDASPARDAAPDCGRALVPSVVRRSLQARLDELPCDLRTLVQDAAVIGEGIRPEALAALRQQPDGDVTAALAELTRRGFLAAATTAPEGDTWFGFRQPLLREAAYARIPHGLRSAKHAVMADWAADSPLAGVPRRPVAPELLHLLSVVERLRG